LEPKFFQSVEELRNWFEAHGALAREVWIGYYKRGSGRTSVTYDEAVVEALCFGWIDGQVRRIDEHSYTNRFTPRGPRSTWSLLNVRRAEEMIRQGRMRPPGLRSFEARAPERTGVYAYEQGPPPAVPLDRAARAAFALRPGALEFFETQPPGYRRTLERWIMTAQRPETRSKRLSAVISASAAGRRVDPLHPYSGKGTPPPKPRAKKAGRRGRAGTP
jgi:uncharacterized protein YdeI (YjbR/CyaY-like superfamily)